MRNAGAYLKSWLGRFEAVARGPADPWLWTPAALLVVLGLLMVLNTTYFLSLGQTGSPFHYFERQLTNLAVGLVAMVVFAHLSVRGLRRLALPLMIAALVMVAAVWIPGVGVVRGGARRWIHLGAVMVEPSELMKFAAVFFLASLLSKREQRMDTFARGPLPIFLIAGLGALLLLSQPDFGATVVLVLVVFAMLFVAGARPAHLGGAGAAALLLLGFQAAHRAYRMRRLTAFLDPWSTARGAGFQLIQSFIALGTGGGWGVGLGASRQKMFYLPQAHTDFLFAVVGEEFGVAGALVVITLFGTIMFRGMKIAATQPDPFAGLLAVGLTALVSFQAFINMAVVSGLVPTKGLPLPFLSYGGTSMVVSMAALGVLLGLGRRPVMR